MYSPTDDTVVAETGKDVCVLHYYRHLFNTLQHTLRDHNSESEKPQSPYTYEEFRSQLSITKQMHDEWEQISGSIDVQQLQNECIRLVEMIRLVGDANVASRTGINVEYYQMLCREYNDFFDALENDSRHDDDDVDGWCGSERNVFYEGLSRYGIHRVDEIAELLPRKSPADITRLYNTLKAEVDRMKADKRGRRKLVAVDDMPQAYEMSDEWIRMEDEQSVLVDGIEDEMYGDNDDGESADDDVITLVEEFARDLVYNVFLRKLNRLSVPHAYEWYNQVKAKKVVDPRGRFHVLELKDMSTNEVEMDDVESESDVDDDDDIERDSGDSLVIPDDEDVWSLGITAEDVREVADQLMGVGSVNNDEECDSIESDAESLTSESTSDVSIDEDADLLSDVEDIDNLKPHNSDFNNIETTQHTDLFFQDNFIVPADEDQTTRGHEYLQELCDYETEQMELRDSMNSRIYELIHLTNLTNIAESDREQILESLSHIENETLHPSTKQTLQINEKHAKKFMHMYNNY